MRFNRTIVPFFFILFSLTVFYGCSKTSGTYSVIQPTPTPALPDLSSVIKRIATQDGCRDFSALMRLTSLDKDNKKDQIEFSLQRKYAAGRTSTFLSVLAPRQETDKALLAIEQPGQATQALTYLPGLRRLNKLNSEKQIGFHGAKVTVQELLSLELNQYTYHTVERVLRGDEPLLKIEFKEQPYLGLGFPLIVGYFRERDQRPVDFELFDMRNELQKRVAIEEVKTIQNRQTITKIAIDDLSQRLKLRLEILKIEYDRGLPDGIFNEKHLITYISNTSRLLDQDR